MALFGVRGVGLYLHRHTSPIQSGSSTSTSFLAFSAFTRRIPDAPTPRESQGLRGTCTSTPSTFECFSGTWCRLAAHDTHCVSFILFLSQPVCVAIQTYMIMSILIKEVKTLSRWQSLLM